MTRHRAKSLQSSFVDPGSKRPVPAVLICPMSPSPDSPSKIPVISAGASGLVLLFLGFSSFRNVKTESKWFGLVSERVDKGPDWLSILLLVGGGCVLTYLVARVAVSPRSSPTDSSNAQSGTEQSPTAPTTNVNELAHGLRVFGMLGLLLVRVSESDAWKLCGWLAVGLSGVGLVIDHWKHHRTSKRDLAVIVLSVIAVVAGFVWALN